MHIQTSRKLNFYTCRSCSKTFNRKNSLKAHLLICKGRKFRSSEKHLNVKNVVKYIAEKHFKENMKKKCDQAKNVIDFNWKAIMKNKR